MNKLSKDMLRMIPTEAALMQAKRPKNNYVDGPAFQKLQDTIDQQGRYHATDCLQVILKEPFTTEAYTMLAAIPDIHPDAAQKIIERGIAASEVMLGADYMQEMEGEFYGFIETRPLMRAMHALFEIKVRASDFPAAIEIGLKAIRLNKNDNIGFRSPVATLLLRMGDVDRAAKLIDSHPNDTMAGITFGRVILALKQGREDDVPELLKEAQLYQNHVLAGIRGEVLVSDALPYGIPVGGTSEALAYLELAAPLWEMTPGAMEVARNAPPPEDIRDRDRRNLGMSL